MERQLDVHTTYHISDGLSLGVFAGLILLVGGITITSFLCVGVAFAGQLLVNVLREKDA